MATKAKLVSEEPGQSEPTQPHEIIAECMRLIQQLPTLNDQQRIVRALNTYFEVGDTF
jgi:hypothetical protein